MDSFFVSRRDGVELSESGMAVTNSSCVSSASRDWGILQLPGRFLMASIAGTQYSNEIYAKIQFCFHLNLWYDSDDWSLYQDSFCFIMTHFEDEVEDEGRS